jgi:hypothetical protein
MLQNYAFFNTSLRVPHNFRFSTVFFKVFRLKNKKAEEKKDPSV